MKWGKNPRTKTNQKTTLLLPLIFIFTVIRVLNRMQLILSKHWSVCKSRLVNTGFWLNYMHFSEEKKLMNKSKDSRLL